MASVSIQSGSISAWKRNIRSRMSCRLSFVARVVVRLTAETFGGSPPFGDILFDHAVRKFDAFCQWTAAGFARRIGRDRLSRMSSVYGIGPAVKFREIADRPNSHWITAMKSFAIAHVPPGNAQGWSKATMSSSAGEDEIACAASLPEITAASTHPASSPHVVQSPAIVKLS